ncbi:TetR family transcriptional regulator [Leptospira perolatii]|uniref:TetR family transcriptional regulator n=1 Tax=Leptospira perolatii TaxID=2023191 RepID=A0A2M9ZIF0_9LEPT|nr:TetR/AcrR family transcriptional regulator [Leptospira perolatii]PJZ68357.1 TetR family transcriptional regulator [Leptospira perolatii]PJZ71845.1 TetR family transcriptional regulator [Leptospira perolatii]
MTTVTRPKRRTRNSLNRETIVQAAFEILNEEGIEGLSMRKIAEKLDCSVASPYSHFKSQEDIIRILISQGEAQLTETLKVAKTKGRTSYEQLVVIARTYYEFSGNNQELHKVMFNTVHGPMHRKAFPKLPTSYRVFLETIREGHRSGEFRISEEEIPSLARTLYSWMYGIIVLDMTDMLKKRGMGDPLDEGFLFFKKMLLGDGSENQLHS